ncbi:MAG TPA: DUF6340 family protein [Cytophagaceae bacterium]
MNNIRIYLLILSIGFFACSRKGTMNIQMLHPSPVTIGQHIKTVALVNRAMTEKNKKNQIEAIVTLEGINQDKQGIQKSLEGLNSILIQSPRLKGELTTIQMTGSPDGKTFLPALSWDSINYICKEYNADAVVAIESFDTDCIITHQIGQISVNNQFGVPIPTPRIYATQKVIVNIGFRIYDPSNQSLVDQHTFTFERLWNANAGTIAEALASLANRQMAINQTCFEAGIAYGRRISPMWVYERRMYYKRAYNEDMRIAGREALVGDWKNAVERWKRVIDLPGRRKLHGKAAFNLALACEVAGDLQGAQEWIKKAYGQYNNKKARYYMYDIQRRIRDFQMLDQQMNNNQNSED